MQPGDLWVMTKQQHHHHYQQKQKKWQQQQRIVDFKPNQLWVPRILLWFQSLSARISSSGLARSAAARVVSSPGCHSWKIKKQTYSTIVQLQICYFDNTVYLLFLLVYAPTLLFCWHLEIHFELVLCTACLYFLLTKCFFPLCRKTRHDEKKSPLKACC